MVTSHQLTQIKRETDLEARIQKLEDQHDA